MDKKRYILFAYDSYYPSGGMDDAKVSFELEEYEEVKSKWEGKYDWFSVFDVETFKTHGASKGEMPKIR